ncbi:hypothetical protein GGI05_005717, partial [Coemansia sp. RSA 2603]
MDHRKEELEKKRAKLAELRRQREERKRQAQQTQEAPRLDAIDINDLVNSLVGDRARSDSSATNMNSPDMSTPLSREASVSGRERAGTAADLAARATSPAQMQAAAASPQPPASRPPHVFSTSELVVFDFAPRERVTYNKEVQTAGDDAPDAAMLTEAEVARRVAELRERDERAARAREEDRARRDAEAVERDAQREAEARRLTAAQRGSILGSAAFAGFIDRAARVVERALDVDYDVTVDYARAAPDAAGDARPQLALVAALADERVRGRAVMDIA